MRIQQDPISIHSTSAPVSSRGSLREVRVEVVGEKAPIPAQEMSIETAAKLDDDFTAARYLNNTEAADRLSEAARNMNHSAEAYLAMCYYFGCHLFPKHELLAAAYVEKSSQWLQAAASKGNCYALFQLGVFLICGIGMIENSQEGIRLLRLSADQGHCGAQNTLGKSLFVFCEFLSKLIFYLKIF